jgi:hypothetical protein
MVKVSKNCFRSMYAICDGKNGILNCKYQINFRKEQYMWKKGQSGNKAGKPVGTKSKTKTEIRELFNQILSDELGNIGMALEQLRTESPKDYMSILLKVTQLLYPTSLGEVENSDSPIIFNWCNLDGSLIF